MWFEVVNAELAYTSAAFGKPTTLETLPDYADCTATLSYSALLLDLRSVKFPGKGYNALLRGIQSRLSLPVGSDCARFLLIYTSMTPRSGFDTVLVEKPCH